MFMLINIANIYYFSSGLVALEELRLDNNIIDSIPSAAFRHLSGLRRLWLKGNRLSGFVPRLFYGLHRLEVTFPVQFMFS